MKKVLVTYYSRTGKLPKWPGWWPMAWRKRDLT